MTRPTVPTKRTERHLAPREISVELNRPPSSRQNSKWPPQNDFYFSADPEKAQTLCDGNLHHGNTLAPETHTQWQAGFALHSP